MISRSLILLSTIILLTSCTVTNLLTSSVKPSEITNLKLLEPYSYIKIIEKGNRAKPDDSASVISKQFNISVLENLKDQIPITGEIFLTDTSTNKLLEKEYESIFMVADKNQNITNLKIPPTIDKLLEANETRFGLIIVCTGFTRVKGNYGKQVAKGAALGLLTLGMYYQSPIKAYSTIYAMILDSKEDNVSFYRKAYNPDFEPLDQSMLKKQYKKIFEGYFYNVKQ
jgi:hypothetical protein